MPHTHVFPLALSADEIKQLKQHYATLLRDLERGLPLQPRMMEELRSQMKDILHRLPGFEKIYTQDQAKHHSIHLQHPDNEILNLPWRLAVEDREYLYLSKGPATQGALPSFEPQKALPLKILVMVSAPEDLSKQGRLAYEEEEQQILQAFESLFADGQVEIDFTNDGLPGKPQTEAGSQCLPYPAFQWTRGL